jgi:hypothetical protein
MINIIMPVMNLQTMFWWPLPRLDREPGLILQRRNENGNNKDTDWPVQ